MARCRFEAVVESQIVHSRQGSVGILAKDPRGLASRLVSLSLQGMPACIVNDPAIQGCHEAWLLGCQGQHQFSPNSGVHTRRNKALSGGTRRRMVWSWCVMPTAPVDMDREGGEIRANATLQ